MFCNVLRGSKQQEDQSKRENVTFVWVVFGLRLPLLEGSEDLWGLVGDCATDGSGSRLLIYDFSAETNLRRKRGSYIANLKQQILVVDEYNVLRLDISMGYFNFLEMRMCSDHCHEEIRHLVLLKSELRIRLLFGLDVLL